MTLLTPLAVVSLLRAALSTIFRPLSPLIPPHPSEVSKRRRKKNVIFVTFPAPGPTADARPREVRYGWGMQAGETRFYRALRVISALPRWYFRLRVAGAERLPATGPCIVAANHASYLDPIVLAIACPRPVRFIVDAAQYRRPLVHWIAARTAAIPVENSSRDVGSVRRALGALRDGAVLGIFPEGGRSSDGALQPARPGAALLALRAGVPLVPAAIAGTFTAYSRYQRFPLPRPVVVRFGAPLALPECWHGHGAKEHLDEATALLMAAIGALLAQAQGDRAGAP
jgi:1-acyl-sn-glycerol-3-phosphate acyltransferase